MTVMKEVKTSDEVIQEVRHIKETLAASFDFDIRRILDDAREKQKHSNHKIIGVSGKDSPHGL